MANQRIPYLLGHHEIAYLFEVSRQTPQNWRKRSILGDPDVVISGNPYWLLPTVLALSVPGRREISPHRLSEYKASIPNGYFAEEMKEPPPLIGIKEIAWLFGKRPGDVSQWRNRGTLVAEQLTLSGSPLWLLDAVLKDARNRQRSVVEKGLRRILVGEREQMKSRRPAGGEDVVADHVFPGARIFTSNEDEEAVAFVHQLFDAGYAVEVRPHISTKRIN